MIDRAASYGEEYVRVHEQSVFTLKEMIEVEPPADMNAIRINASGQRINLVVFAWLT